MPIACPYCDYRINLKSPKPGRFRPRCPKCVKLFQLVVPAESPESCFTQAIPNDAAATSPDRSGRANSVPPVGDTLPARRNSPAGAAAGGLAPGSHLIGLANTAPDTRKAPAPKPVPPPRPVMDEDQKLPRTDVRGYRIERELGRGGMGAVYLARQLSLDRLVALKVMGKKWANDPVFVARFTREAFAAAQLSHPNIVHIHDIGEVNGARFFSMEYVPGRSLSELVKKHGKLDPETAVGYVLQAARGLKHAHDRGMIHRDVKPDNLLLDDSGLVKVADLGLVKTGNSEFGNPREDTEPMPDPALLTPSQLRAQNVELTGARIALGTPAYMSPEQCRDAATVDHRADIYSLGCTLYVLVTGRPPFEGTTAVELMTKHAYEPLVPPEQIVARVPKELSEIIQRMMAKSADDRFASMAEVIRTLEAWLGVHHSGSFCPQEEQIGKLEAHVHEFNSAPRAILRGRVLKGAFSVVLLAGALLLFFGKLTWVFGLASLVATGTLAYFAIDGVARKGHLFTRVRQFLFGLSWADWAFAAAVLLLFVVLLWGFGVLGIAVGCGLAGIALALAVRYGLDRQVDDERRGSIEACDKLLRRLRANGLDEQDLRLFVAKFSGRHWEEFFETMFGYEAKVAARAVLLRGGAAGPRERHAAWREPILHAIERIEKHRKEAREQRLLQAVEQARLLAAGLAEQEAADKARAAAEAMVREADRIRHAEADRVAQASAPQPPVNVAGLVRGGSNPEFVFEPSRRDPFGRLVGLFVGPHVRAVLGAVLLAACGLWAHQNGLVPGVEVKAQAEAAVQSQDLSGFKENAALDANRTTQPLHIEGVPEHATVWVDSFNVGLAGLLLFASLFYRGNTMSLFVLLGAGVAVAGHRLGIRTVEPIRDYHVALMLGTVLALVGFRKAVRY